jgi:glycosyltransferase involved in cell wall biosynthesis
MKSNKTKLSIGIPAHNEEKNIGKLIEQIFKQKRNNYVLQEVKIVCDGCTDSTAEIASSYSKKHKIVKLVNDGKRLGKSSRITSIYNLTTSDIVISIDADITLANNFVLDSIANCFQKGINVGLVGCNDIPQKPNGFFESIVVSWINHWQKMTRPINKYKNVHNCHGCILGISRKYARKLKIPSTISADDTYIFYKAISLGFEFIYCPDAKVYFKAPKNYDDFVSQSVRFGKSGAHVQNMFPQISDGINSLNYKQKIMFYASSLIEQPIKFSLAILLQVIVKLQLKFSISQTNGIWSSVKSSK